MVFQLKISSTLTKYILLSIVFTGLALGVTGCGPAPNENSASLPANDAYPVLLEGTSVQIDAYPAPEIQTGTLLAFTKPINLQASEIKGVGPAGLPIVILNITLMGEQLGAGVIDADGTFSIPVALQSNIRIGLSADIEAFGLSKEGVQPGDNAITVPLVGYFYDSTRIGEE